MSSHDEFISLDSAKEPAQFSQTTKRDENLTRFGTLPLLS
jgi:hypothetical protein